MDAYDLEVSTRDLYDAVERSHINAAWLDSYHGQQRAAWESAGSPMLTNEKGHRLADGFDVLPPMQRQDLHAYLGSTRKYLEYLGMSYAAGVRISFEDYKSLTKYL